MILSKWWLLWLIPLCAAGCASLIFPSSTPPVYYQLDYQPTLGKCPQAFKKGLRVWTFTSSDPYSRTGMVVLKPGGEVSFSSAFQWVASPGTLLSESLQRDLTLSSLFPRVVGANDPTGAPLELSGHVFVFACERTVDFPGGPADRSEPDRYRRGAPAGNFPPAVQHEKRTICRGLFRSFCPGHERPGGRFFAKITAGYLRRPEKLKAGEDLAKPCQKPNSTPLTPKPRKLLQPFRGGPVQKLLVVEPLKPCGTNCVRNCGRRWTLLSVLVNCCWETPMVQVRRSFIANLSGIHSAGRQLLEIINDLLDSAKYASGDVVSNLASLVANLYYRGAPADKRCHRYQRYPDRKRRRAMAARHYC